MVAAQRPATHFGCAISERWDDGPTGALARPPGYLPAAHPRLHWEFCLRRLALELNPAVSRTFKRDATLSFPGEPRRTFRCHFAISSRTYFEPFGRTVFAPS
jgi:hypothetical protein